MPRLHLYDACDKPGCAGRSLDYERLPACRSCQARVCRRHVIRGSIVLTEEQFNSDCTDCGADVTTWDMTAAARMRAPYPVQYTASQDTAALADEAAIRRSIREDFIPVELARAAEYWK